MNRLHAKSIQNADQLAPLAATAQATLEVWRGRPERPERAVAKRGLRLLVWIRSQAFDSLLLLRRVVASGTGWAP